MIPESTHEGAVKGWLLAEYFVVHKASVVISYGPPGGSCSDFHHGVSQWRQSFDFCLEIGELSFQ